MARKNNQHRNTSGRGSYNGNGGDTTMGGIGRGTTPLKCQICNRTGHEASTCKHCTRCGKYGHFVTECRVPARTNSRNTNISGGNNTNNDNHLTNNTTATGHTNNAKRPYPMAGYTFASCIPNYTSSANYCPSCNVTTHHQRHCPNPDKVSTLQYSILTCWKCGFRGHTGDDCQHPAPSSQTNVCGICHRAGHTANTCNDETEKKLQPIVRRPATTRFYWENECTDADTKRHPTQNRHQEILSQLSNSAATWGAQLTPEREAQLRRELSHNLSINFSAQPLQHYSEKQRHIQLMQQAHVSLQPWSLPSYQQVTTTVPQQVPATPPPAYSSPVPVRAQPVHHQSTHFQPSSSQPAHFISSHVVATQQLAMGSSRINALRAHGLNSLGSYLFWHANEDLIGKSPSSSPRRNSPRPPRGKSVASFSAGISSGAIHGPWPPSLTN